MVPMVSALVRFHCTIRVIHLYGNHPELMLIINDEQSQCRRTVQSCTIHSIEDDVRKMNDVVVHFVKENVYATGVDLL